MKPSLPKGTRDFPPDELEKRKYIFSTIRSVFELYGYREIETPAMENLSVLEGKYGEEGDKLLYRILNSGPVVDELNRKPADTQFSLSDLSEKGLRYDLTVPFARFVVMNQHELVFPFKRFQVQPVWRADRPQKGRYREFYQCDADVIGSNALYNEVELLQLIDKVFEQLKLPVTIKINNRKILTALAAHAGFPGLVVELAGAIDKIEKVGLENAIQELIGKGFTESAIEKIKPVLMLRGSNKEKVETLRALLSSVGEGKKGLEELDFVFDLLSTGDAIQSKIEFDLTLARGLNYYTGAIIEVKANDTEMGSICGGGRYDDLTGLFGLKNMSGVGISFGADRIYDVLSARNLFPEKVTYGVQLLFINYGEEEAKHCLKLLKQARKAGIRSELYPDASKIKKQMSYADARKIPFVAIIGSDELTSGKISLKNMTSGSQHSCTLEEVIALINK